MLTAIEGAYENGHIILNEKPEHITKARVIVVFRDEKVPETKYAPTKRPFGLAKIHLSDDFNEPLDNLIEYT